MKLKDLIQNLQEIEKLHGGDLTVVIPVINPKLLGPSPSTAVTGAMTGFDWNKGKVFIHPEKDLIIKPSE